LRIEKVERVERVERVEKVEWVEWVEWVGSECSISHRLRRASVEASS
jgi:hypothetical protein